MNENMNATTVLDREAITHGAELLIPSHGSRGHGQKTLAVRITSKNEHIGFTTSQAGNVYVSFVAYRIRKVADKQERSSFGHQRFYMVRLADVTPF